MKKITFYLLPGIICVLFFFSCDEQSGMEEKMRTLTTDVSCEKISVPFDIGNNIQMLRIGDFIIFNDFYTDPMLTVYSMKSDSVISRFLTKGRGPNELLPPSNYMIFGIRFISMTAIRTIYMLFRSTQSP